MPIKFNKKKGWLNNLISCLKLNFVFYLVFFVLGLYLSLISKDLYRGIFTLLFCTLFSYFSHRLSHRIFPLNYKYFHILHHNIKYNKKWWAELIECIVNLIQIGGIILIPINILIEKYTNIKLFNNYLILYFSLVYTSTHMINYHILDVNTHRVHHEDTNTNYGPDYVDILFNTKSENSTLEDMNTTIINALVSAIVVMIIIIKYN